MEPLYIILLFLLWIYILHHYLLFDYLIWCDASIYNQCYKQNIKWKTNKTFAVCVSHHPIIKGSVFSAENFYAEISTGKSWRFMKITMTMEKFKHKFWCTRLFITIKSKLLIDDLTVQIKWIAPADLFHLRRWCEFIIKGVHVLVPLYTFRSPLYNVFIILREKSQWRFMLH
jgi:hypothetical protein